MMAPTMEGPDTDSTPAQAQMHEAPQAPAHREVTTHEEATSERQARSHSAPAAAAPASAAPATAAIPKVAPAPSMPRAEPFVLPVNDLIQLADQSGLIWVHSDTGKVAEVQSLIAAEPRAAHVPREPVAPVQIDEGPLVLVETRRDLAEMRLPVEQEAVRV